VLEQGSAAAVRLVGANPSSGLGEGSLWISPTASLEASCATHATAPPFAVQNAVISTSRKMPCGNSGCLGAFSSALQ